MMLPPPECSSISGTAASVSACAVATLKVNASLQVLGRGVQQRFGHGAADVVDDDVQLAERLDGRAGQLGGGLGMREVGDDDVGAPADRRDLLGDGLQLGLGARGDDDVGADFGECEGDRRAEAAAGTGDDCDLVVKSELVEDHVSLFPCRRTP